MRVPLLGISAGRLSRLISGRIPRSTLNMICMGLVTSDAAHTQTSVLLQNPNRAASDQKKKKKKRITFKWNLPGQNFPHDDGKAGLATTHKQKERVKGKEKWHHAFLVFPAEPRDCTTRTTSFREKLKPLCNDSRHSAGEVKSSTSFLSGSHWNLLRKPERDWNPSEGSEDAGDTTSADKGLEAENRHSEVSQAPFY